MVLTDSLREWQSEIDRIIFKSLGQMGSDGYRMAIRLLEKSDRPGGRDPRGL